MNLFDRVFAIHSEFSHAHLPVSRRRLEDALECSPATVKRIIEHMRDRLGAPISYDRVRNGYYYDHSEGAPYELPGLWFNAEELHALLAMQQLLARIQPGLLDRHIAPLQRRIEQLLGRGVSDPLALARRVRILGIASRRATGAALGAVVSALIRRRRIYITYHGRERDARSKRSVSPQRLVHYRDNWYLDAWCHHTAALRTFSVDRIQAARLEDTSAEDLPETTLDAYFEGAYGIFGGEPTDTAVLRFSRSAARWVADEEWHPAQEGRALADGRYELRVPYADPRELIMDILKHGPEVEVIAPPALRETVAARLRQAVNNYEDPGSRNEPPADVK